MRYLLLVLLACGACRSTVEPAKPWIWDPDGPAVTLGQSFGVATSWEGECEPGLLDIIGMAPTPGGRKTVPCNFVDYDIEVRCDDDACRWRVEDSTILITPTKLGTLKAHVTLDPKSGFKRKKTFDLKPVLVATPTSAAAICDLIGNGRAQVDVSLYAQRAELWHGSTVRAGGKECRGSQWDGTNQQRALTCEIDATNAELEISGPGYKLTASAPCTLVFPAPSGSRAAPDHHLISIYDPYNNQCPELLAKSRDDFVALGWTVDSTDETSIGKTEHGRPTGSARMEVSRLGARGTVTIKFAAEGCMWELATTARVRGTDQPL